MLCMLCINGNYFSIIKITHIHKVWSWSVGVILTGFRMFRTPVFIVGTTFVKPLSPQNCHFLRQDDTCSQSLELESWSIMGYPDRSWDIQDT